MSKGSSGWSWLIFESYYMTSFNLKVAAHMQVWCRLATNESPFELRKVYFGSLIIIYLYALLILYNKWVGVNVTLIDVNEY